MNKLLHERLRDIVNNELCTCTLSEETIDCVRASLKLKGYEVSYAKDMQNILNYIADEIEKYYIPRPRFEDGEPLQVGDAFVQKTFDEETVLQKIGIALYGKLGNMVWFPDEVVQRPEPKVLDSDGIEIKVGDTVWIIESGAKGKVEEINKDRAYVKCDDGWLADVHVSNLTHREPDSLKKAVGDLGELLNFPMCDDIKLDKVEEVYNRLTAIMERDA